MIWLLGGGATVACLVSLFLGGQIAMRAFAAELMNKYPDLAEELHRRETSRKEKT